MIKVISTYLDGTRVLESVVKNKEEAETVRRSVEWFRMDQNEGPVVIFEEVDEPA
jgi:hypothetical protein